MDKFEQHIKSAQNIQQPNNNFVDKTMSQIELGSNNSRRGFKTWGPIFAGAVVVLAIIFLVLPINAKKTTSVKLNPASKPSNAVADTTGSASNGTDDASLTSDINSINSSIGQENVDQVSTNSALNDQSQEIVVPTN
jgi:hypothetical protein